MMKQFGRDGAGPAPGAGVIRPPRRRETEAPPSAAERTPAEQIVELTRANEELRALWSSTDIALLVLDLDLRVRWLTRACAEFFGLVESDVGRPLNDRYLRFYDSHLVEDLHRLLTGGAVSDRQVRAHDGRWLLRRIAPLRPLAPVAAGVVVTLVDVTLIKASAEGSGRHEQQQTSLAELRRIHERLRVIDERKDEFLAVLGHELRNPLSGLHGGLALLDLDLPPERVAWTRQMMKRQVAQLVSLLDDVLDITRISHGKLRLRRKRISVKSVIDRAAASALELLEARRHLFVQHVDDVEVDADATRLEQVVVNLLTNAAKFTPEGGRIELCAQRRDGRLVLEVKDDGPGVPAEMRDTVFEPFVQVAGGRYSRDGLGIGLALVKQLVEMHGGSTTIDDNVGGGAVFTVTLPLAVPEEHADSRAVSSSPGLRCAPPCKRVLLVEDKPELAEVLSLRLEQHGLELKVARDGEAALTQAAVWRPDAMIIDIGLPAMSGIEVARRVRATASLSRTVLIALSGYTHAQARCDAFEAGFDEHIAKPADCAVLLQLLGHGG